MSRKTKSKLITSLLEILLFVCISFIIIVPLLIMILGSFKDATEVTAFNLELPKQWLFENYVTVFEEADLITAFFNGILITVVSTAITIGVSSLAAFIVARRKTSLSRFYIISFYRHYHSYADHSHHQAFQRVGNLRQLYERHLIICGHQYFF